MSALSEEGEDAAKASKPRVPRWSAEEDLKLRGIIDTAPEHPAWTTVAEDLGTGRTAAACAQHWLVLSGKRGKRKADAIDDGPLVPDVALVPDVVRQAPFHPAFPPKELVDGVVSATAPSHVWLRRWASQSAEMLGNWFASNVPELGVFDTTAREASLYELSAAEYINERASGRVTCVEYVEALVKRAHFFSELNCFTAATLHMLGAACGAQAAALDALALKRGVQAIAPLYGLPVPVKDTACTTDFPTGFGTAILASFLPSRDAALVARLRACHAIIFGKTATPAWARSYHTCSHCNGVTRNPHDPALTVGGSSGGSAVAVAARMAPAAITEDTGGSTRSPALHCGNFGYDPPRGKYPNAGVAALTLTHDQLGLTTRTFECILLLDAALTGRCEAHMAASARTAARPAVRVAFPQVCLQPAHA